MNNIFSVTANLFDVLAVLAALIGGYYLGAVTMAVLAARRVNTLKQKLGRARRALIFVREWFTDNELEQDYYEICEVLNDAIKKAGGRHD